MSLPEFAYQRPATLGQAVDMLAADPEARALAGGQTLIPALKQRLSRPSTLVDLQDIDELHGIEISQTHVSIGALTRHYDTAHHTGIAQAIPALCHMARGISHPQVRYMGTMGGSLANSDPAADYPAAVLALGADIETTQRRITAQDFFLGLFTTALEPAELITRIHFPRPARAGYHKFANPASGYVTTGAFVADGDQGIRVAINGAGPCPFRCADFETRLAHHFDPAALEGAALSPEGFNNDIHASAAYRAHLAVIATGRAVTQALVHPVSK